MPSPYLHWPSPPAPSLPPPPACPHLQPCVHLDAGQDALRLEHIHKGAAVTRGLVQRLLKHDAAADVLPQAWSHPAGTAAVPGEGR